MWGDSQHVHCFSAFSGHCCVQVQPAENHSDMTQDGTTCLLSGMLSKSELCQMKLCPLSGGPLASARSIGSSAPLSISLPARPDLWEEGVSDTLSLENHGSVTTDADKCGGWSWGDAAPVVHNGRHVFVSPRSKEAARCVPEESSSTETNSVVPKLNLCLAGLSQLVLERPSHSAGAVQDDLLAQLQPWAMPCSTVQAGADKDTDICEQFDCGPVSSSYIDSRSLCEGYPLGAPSTDRSVSGSVVDSFQSLPNDGKVRSVTEKGSLH